VDDDCSLGDRRAKVICGSVDRFSSCYDQDATQEDIYDNDVKPLLDVLYTGVVSTSLLRVATFGRELTLTFLHKTVTIFAYGVTSSGKTHTMQGSPSQPGIIPRVMHVRMIADFVWSRYLLAGRSGNTASLSPGPKQETKLQHLVFRDLQG